LSYINLWKETANVKQYSSASSAEQTRIVELLMSPDALQSYYVETLIAELSNHISPKDFWKVGANYIKNGTHLTYPIRLYDIVTTLAAHDVAATKQLIIDARSNQLSKLLLTMDGISLEEEILGLRALATSKYLPDAIRQRKYRPKLDALMKLPPVMRLKTLEALTAGRRVKYSIFRDIERNAFEALLFTTAMKYSDRVRAISNKYDELKYMGQMATVKIDGRCEMCGDYSISITSGVVRTATGLQNDGSIKSLAHAQCPFCYANTVTRPNIKVVK